jgi:hypothetical protein
MRKPLLESQTVTPSGAVMGRPRKVCPPYTPREIRKQPPPDVCATIEELAAAGGTIVGIAAALKTTREVLRRWMTENPALQHAFDFGRERERHELHSLLVRDARDGEKPNINAMFLLKARHGYREGDAGEQGSRVNITFNIPAALSREDFMKTVNP